VDNNSSDGSQALIRSKYPQVKLIANKNNVGFGRANNQGASIAKGRYILLLNSDTVVSEDGLDHLYRFMESHADAGIAGGKILSPENSV
jgi:GT2 family glycosyltransferase